MNVINIPSWNTKIEKAFLHAKENIPIYERDLKIINSVLVNSLNIEERLTLEKRQRELSDLIDDLTNDTSFGFYVIESQYFLSEFETRGGKNVSVSFMKKDRVVNPKLVELTNAFLEIVKKYNNILKLEIPEFNVIEKQVVCPCGNSKEFDTIDNRSIYCLKCGMQVQENIGSKSTYKDNERVNTSGKYRYTRMIHFRNCFRQFQGKQKTKIPEKCIEDVKARLAIHGIDVNSSSVNPQHIRSALQDTEWSSQYENFVMIWSIITEKPCPDVSHLEEQITNDFVLVERVYNEVISNPNEERSSFMSYPYVLCQLLTRHGWKCDMTFFSMLKSDRINWLDDIMEQIYNRLGWTGFKPMRR